MAHIIGTSGAWKSVCRELNKLGLYAEKISDISNLLKTTNEEYQLIEEKTIKEVDSYINSLKTELSNLEASFESNIKECRERISTEIALAKTALQLLQEDVNFFQKLLNYFKIRTAKRKIESLQNQHENCPQTLLKEIDIAKKNFEGTQKSREALIRKKCGIEKSKVDLLERVCSSPDLAGATAELELIESLKTLPSNYYIISDIELELDRAIRFDNEWLGSAQIDHAVVCPYGIFVIEVKNWSKTFAQQGDYYNPYQQVKRASYLCYKLIGERYNLKTRSIIAYKGSIPNKPNNSYAKVLSIHEVKGYILWFKDSAATDQIVQIAADRLSRF